MTEFVMPSLGADMDSGTLVEWLVKPGDTVHRGDIVAVVDTTKSAIEVEVFSDGVVAELLVPPGTSVPVGTPLARLSAVGADLGAVAPEPAPPPAMIVEKPASHRRVAGVSSTIIGEEGGEPAVASPLVRHLAHERGVDLATLRGSGPEGVITRADVEAAAAPRLPAAGPEVARPRVSPLARRRAGELGVDLVSVTGTGAGGAVTVGDVERAASGRTQLPAPRPAAASAEPATAEPLAEPAAAEPTAAQRSAARAAAMRQTIAALMARSKREIPHYYLQQTVDLAAADEFVRNHNAEADVSARILPAVLMLKAAAVAVHAVPEMNGFMVDGEFRRSERVHLGVAVSLRGGGLVAPAIHDADTLSLPALMAALKDLVARTRAGRLRGSQMSDPTITVTNLGDQGVELVHGVIYPPQVALVGFGRVVQRPWAVDGMLTVRPVVTVTLAADHRVSDGHRGGRYLAAVADLLQRPEDL
jgi:pyruvate dehydrogenase E2 component (dihydrolipoamide acetyltransferase)